MLGVFCLWSSPANPPALLSVYKLSGLGNENVMPHFLLTIIEFAQTLYFPPRYNLYKWPFFWKSKNTDGHWTLTLYGIVFLHVLTLYEDFFRLFSHFTKIHENDIFIFSKVSAFTGWRLSWKQWRFWRSSNGKMAASRNVTEGKTSYQARRCYKIIVENFGKGSFYDAVPHFALPFLLEAIAKKMKEGFDLEPLEFPKI